MTAAATVPFPPSRTLATWWPELRPWNPSALWIRHLTLCRLDAPVRVATSAEIDPLGRALLEAVAHHHSPPIGPQFLERCHHELAGRGLIQRAGQQWKLTETGTRVLRGEKVAPLTVERRSFYFASPHEGPPSFLPLEQPPATPLPGKPAAELADLRAWIARDEGTKRRAGFPLDVLELATEPPHAALEDRWRQVVVAHLEQVSLLLVLTTTEAGEQVRGFAFQPATWQVNLHQPVLTLGAAWREQLPELTVEPSAEQWRQAWQGWGQPRSLPAGDLEACLLERQGPLLRVRAPVRLVEQLRKASSDAVKGETWLLTGNGSTRSLALVELVEQVP